MCISLGTDESSARDAYHTLVSGLVTPCTVLDVLEDLGVFYNLCQSLISKRVCLYEGVENETHMCREAVNTKKEVVIG